MTHQFPLPTVGSTLWIWDSCSQLATMLLSRHPPHSSSSMIFSRMIRVVLRRSLTCVLCSKHKTGSKLQFTI